MDYRVDLPAFHGPLDLLLYLVKRHEVDVLDIPVAAIAEQFRAYLEVIQVVDVEMAGDFVVMAATLMEMKSRLLLPRPESPAAAAEQAEAEDPRRELVKQLIEYKKFKDAAAKLDHLAADQQKKLPRLPVAQPAAPAGPPPVRPVELWDLLAAFGRLMQEAESLQTRTIIADDTPQEVYRQHVLARLKRDGRVEFRDLFEPPYYRVRLVGLFLAVLELIKNRAITLEQAEPFGDIWLSPLAEKADAVSGEAE